MYVITGGLGQTGSALGKLLLEKKQLLRLVVRKDDARAQAWRAQGAEVVMADMGDAKALARAFEGAQGAYLMNPPDYTAGDLFARAQAVQAALVTAANEAGVPHVVALSSVGAHQPSGTGNIRTTHLFENQLRDLRGTCTVLRAANFAENWAWSFKPVPEQGVLPSMLLPLDRAVPTVSARDIGRTAAELLLDPAGQRRIVELHGPSPVSPNEAAAVLAALLGKPVHAEAVPESAWPAVFAALGFPPATVEAFCEMYRGFNDGTVSFEGTHQTRYGATDIRTALSACMSAPSQA